MLVKLKSKVSVVNLVPSLVLKTTPYVPEEGLLTVFEFKVKVIAIVPWHEACASNVSLLVMINLVGTL